MRRSSRSWADHRRPVTGISGRGLPAERAEDCLAEAVVTAVPVAAVRGGVTAASRRAGPLAVIEGLPGLAPVPGLLRVLPDPADLAAGLALVLDRHHAEPGYGVEPSLAGIRSRIAARWAPRPRLSYFPCRRRRITIKSSSGVRPRGSIIHPGTSGRPVPDLSPWSGTGATWGFVLEMPCRTGIAPPGAPLRALLLSVTRLSSDVNSPAVSPSGRLTGSIIVACPFCVL